MDAFPPPPPDAEIPKKPTDRLLINMSPGITHFSRSFISGQGFRPTGRAYFCRKRREGGGGARGRGGGWTFPLAFFCSRIRTKRLKCIYLNIDIHSQGPGLSKTPGSHLSILWDLRLRNPANTRCFTFWTRIQPYGRHYRSHTHSGSNQVGREKKKQKQKKSTIKTGPCSSRRHSNRLGSSPTL